MVCLVRMLTAFLRQDSCVTFGMFDYTDLSLSHGVMLIMPMNVCFEGRSPTEREREI